jgi:hypothetical protein
MTSALGPLEHLGRFDAQAIPEATGIVQSRRFPGIFWVHNDSGNPPLLFVVRSDGRIVRRFRLAVPNLDWEDITIDDQGHLYLGDIGNNGGVLRVRVIYRIDELDPSSTADNRSTRHHLGALPSGLDPGDPRGPTGFRDRSRCASVTTSSLDAPRHLASMPHIWVSASLLAASHSVVDARARGVPQFTTPGTRDFPANR